MKEAANRGAPSVEAMKRVQFAVALLFLLQGCMSEQSQQLAACKMESLTRHFGKSPAADAGEINACMEARGYVRRIAPGCQPASIMDSPVCFQPDNWLGRIGMQIELAIKSK